MKTDSERTGEAAVEGATSGYAAPTILSRADCEERLAEYMVKHGHEGTATCAEKEQAFRRSYWDFERTKAVPHKMNIYDRHDFNKCNCEEYGPYPDHAGNPRKKYHEMLDEAMNETKEGDSFLPTFVAKILHDAKSA